MDEKQCEEVFQKVVDYEWRRIQTELLAYGTAVTLDGRLIPQNEWKLSHDEWLILQREKGRGE